MYTPIDAKPLPANPAAVLLGTVGQRSMSAVLGDVLLLAFLDECRVAIRGDHHCTMPVHEKLGLLEPQLVVAVGELALNQFLEQALLTERSGLFFRPRGAATRSTFCRCRIPRACRRGTAWSPARRRSPARFSHW